MAGTFRGRIEALISEVNEYLQAGVVFKNIFDVLNAHPGTTLVSLGYGSGTGTGYPDDPAPFGDNAHFVFRFDTNANRTWPFYVFCTVGGISSAVAATNVKGNGGFPSSGFGQVFMSAAVGIGGDQNPYNGTQNADGTDTKPTTIWANPTGGSNVMVIPASNSAGGTDGVNKNNCFYVYNEGAAGVNVRYHIVCDDDNIACFWSEGDNGDHEMAWFGQLTPNPAFSSYGAPLAGFTHDSPGAELVLNSALLNTKSGVVDPDNAETTWQASSIQLIAPEIIMNNTYFPNAHEGVIDSFSVAVAANEPSVKGFRGDSPFLAVTWGIPSTDTDLALNLFVGGPSAASNNKPVFPWDGATVPGSSVSRTGVDFTRVP